MMKILTTIIIFSVFTFGQIGIDRTYGIKKKTKVEQWKVLDDKDYSMQYPSDWDLNQSGEMETSFILLAPLENEADQFRENINLIIQDLRGHNMDLDQYTSISEKQIQTHISNSDIIESKRVQNDQGTFHKLIYTGDQGVFHLKFVQYYYVTDFNAYVLTFTCEQNTFSKFQDTGENILNSFKIKK